jgi:hypothetical protein
LELLKSTIVRMPDVEDQHQRAAAAATLLDQAVTKLNSAPSWTDPLDRPLTPFT